MSQLKIIIEKISIADGKSLILIIQIYGIANIIFCREQCYAEKGNINDAMSNHLCFVKRKGHKAPFNELMFVHYLTSSAFWLVTIEPA